MRELVRMWVFPHIVIIIGKSVKNRQAYYQIKITLEFENEEIGKVTFFFLQCSPQNLKYSSSQL